MSFEFPRRGRYWSYDQLKKLLREMKMHKARLDGCQFDFRSPKDGNPINMPWTVATNDPYVSSALDQKQCTGVNAIVQTVNLIILALARSLQPQKTTHQHWLKPSTQHGN